MKKKFTIDTSNTATILVEDAPIVKVTYADVESEIEAKLNVHLTGKLKQLFYDAVKSNPEKVTTYLRYVNLNDVQAFERMLAAKL